MPKTKHRAAPKKHQNHMDKVKIKRAKRTHHEISTKEKVLGGLGVGSALISGVGAVATNPNSTQFVRNVEDGVGGRVKDVLNSVFGVQKAAASSTVTVNGRSVVYNTAVGANGSVIYTFQLSDGSNVSANSADIQSTIASLTSLLSSGGAGGQAALISEEISILRQLYLLNQGGGNNTQPSVTDVADDENGGESGETGQNPGGGTGGGTQPSVTDVADDENGGEFGDAGQNPGGGQNSGDDEVEVLNEDGGGGGSPSVTNVGDDGEVEVLTETGAGGGGGGTGGLGGGGGGIGGSGGSGGGGATTGSQNTDAATIASLQAQIAALQNRLNSLQHQSATPVYQNDPNLLAQISQLQSQINALSQALSRIQGQSVTTYSQNSSGLQYSQVVAAQGGQTAGVQTGGTYTVKKGDNLWNISKKYYGDGRLWRNILTANPQCLSRPGNVRTLKVGYVLTIPTLNNQSTIQTYSNQPKSQTQPAAAQNSSTIKTYNLNSQSTVKQTLNNQNSNQEQEVEVLSETDSLSGQNTNAIKQSGGANILGAATQNNSNVINAASVGNSQKPTFVPSVSDLSDVE